MIRERRQMPSTAAVPATPESELPEDLDAMDAPIDPVPATPDRQLRVVLKYLGPDAPDPDADPVGSQVSLDE